MIRFNKHSTSRGLLTIMDEPAYIGVDPQRNSPWIIARYGDEMISVSYSYGQTSVFISRSNRPMTADLFVRSAPKGGSR